MTFTITHFFGGQDGIDQQHSLTGVECDTLSEAKTLTLAEIHSEHGKFPAGVDYEFTDDDGNLCLNDSPHEGCGCFEIAESND